MAEGKVTDWLQGGGHSESIGSLHIINNTRTANVKHATHPLYAMPLPLTHAMDENFMRLLCRACGRALLGALLGIPLAFLTILLLTIVLPVRCLLCIIGRLFYRPLFHLCAIRHGSCDMWWPLSRHADPYASMTQCIVTLAGALNLQRARENILDRVVAPVPAHVAHRHAVPPSAASAAYDTRQEAITLIAHVRNLKRIPPRSYDVPPSIPVVHKTSICSHRSKHSHRLPVSTPLSARRRSCMLCCSGGDRRRRRSMRCKLGALIQGEWKKDMRFELDNHVIEVTSLEQKRTLSVHAFASSTVHVNENACSTPTMGGHDTASLTGNGADTPSAMPFGRARVASLRDLEGYVNHPTAHWLTRRPPWSVKLLPNFGNESEESACSLAIIEMQSSLADHLCPLRFISLWTGGFVSFECPAQTNNMLAHNNQPPYNILLSFSTLALTTAPLSLVAGMCARRSPVWQHTAERVGTVTTNPYLSAPPPTTTPPAARPTTTRRHTNASSTLLQQQPQRRYRVSSVTNGSRKQSLASTSATSAIIGVGPAPAHKRVTWARISNMDELLRAERILRAQTQDLLLAFVAGALRRHFRSYGIRHPPNTRIVMPMSNRCGRESIAIGRRRACDFTLVPFTIPTGVEGAIPRIWAVQRALINTNDDSFTLANNIAQRVGNLSMPRRATSWFVRQAYSNIACSVSFLRVQTPFAPFDPERRDPNGGRLRLTPMLEDTEMHSVLSYTPVPDDTLAHFGFVQCGHEMVVTLTADARYIPEPDRLLTMFQSEVVGLLRQLCVRLMNVMHATYIIPHMPPADEPVQQPVPVSQQRPLGVVVGEQRPPSIRIDESSDPNPSTRLLPADEDEWIPAITIASTSAIHMEVDDRPYTKPRALSTCSGQISRRLTGSHDTTPHTSKETSTSRCPSANSLCSDDQSSIREIERLMESVQVELDELRSNPRGARDEYNRKLATLETKMHTFHESIATRVERNRQHKNSSSNLLSPNRQLTVDSLQEIAPKKRSVSHSALADLDAVPLSRETPPLIYDDMLSPFFDETKLRERRASRVSEIHIPSQSRRGSFITQLIPSTLRRPSTVSHRASARESLEMLPGADNV